MKYTPIFLLLMLVSGYGIEAKSNVDCSLCVNFVGESIQFLLNAILNGAVSSCATLCSHVTNKAGVVTCNILCDYVGIKTFIKIIDVTDPDPVYICQQLDSCTHTTGGQVVFNATAVTPQSAPVGSTIVINFVYTVLNETSAGYVLVDIAVPFDLPVADEILVNGQAPGVYGYKFSLSTVSNSNTNFSPGLYNVTLAVCAGDCSNSHPYGGTYAVALTNFTLTN